MWMLAQRRHQLTTVLCDDCLSASPACMLLYSHKFAFTEYLLACIFVWALRLHSHKNQFALETRWAWTTGHNSRKYVCGHQTLKEVKTTLFHSFVSLYFDNKDWQPSCALSCFAKNASIQSFHHPFFRNFGMLRRTACRTPAAFIKQLQQRQGASLRWFIIFPSSSQN